MMDILLRLAICFAVRSLVQGPTLDEHISRLTGATPVDCGTFSTSHNGVALPIRPTSKATTKVDSMRESLACAEQALKDRKGFKIVQRGPAIDSEISSGVVGTADGLTVWFVSDSAPCGLPRRCASTFETKPCRLADVTIEALDTRNKTLVFKCGG